MMFSFAVIDGILATAFYLEALNLSKFSNCASYIFLWIIFKVCSLRGMKYLLPINGILVKTWQRFEEWLQVYTDFPVKFELFFSRFF